jgi:hypothetical protein
LSKCAKNTFKITASHPAGGDESGNPNKNLWAPPEGTCPAPPEKNPLVKLLMETLHVIGYVAHDQNASINHANESYPWTWRILAYTR